jgi:hypothetical protein
MLVACTCLFIAHGRYASLLVLTPPLLITGVRLLSVYTITPDSFTLAIRGMKPRHVFPLQNITEIEKEYTKSGKLKSIVIRYRKEGMYHNFLVIKKDVLDEFLAKTNMKLIWIMDAEKEVDRQSHDMVKWSEWEGVFVYEGDFVSGEFKCLK